MKKILGLVFSHRKLGNSELLVKEIMSRVPGDNILELIRVTDLKLEPCRACYYCLSHPGCNIKDDFNYIINKIREADAVVTGVPVYLLGLHGYYKMFTDRLVGSYNYAASTKGKPFIITIPYGTQGWRGYSGAAALVMPRLLQMNVLDCWFVHATLPGECFMAHDNLDYAGSLADRLFRGQHYTPGKRGCSWCGNDIFRFTEDGGVECVVCSAVGVLKQGNVPDFSESEYCRFTAEEIGHHFNVWLKEMKDKFHNVKDSLKDIQQKYRDMNWWIKPD
jgi:multimeric flavodoxin WrbA